MEPAISVVVPLYNKAPYVERALRSIVAQDVTAYEVLVVDDGSTDDGPARVAAFGDPRVRLLAQPNAGPGAARNRGIAEARGPILAFLDADDEWRPGYLHHVVDALARAPEAAAVSCAHVLVPPGASTAVAWQRRGIVPGLFRADPRTSPQLLVALVAFMWTGATAARTELVRELGGFYERRARYGEDAVLMLKLALRAPIAISLEPLAVYHRGGSTLSLRDELRPIEPFLLDPDEVERATPAELRALLREFLSLRAGKTACVLTYWGRWREGRALLQRFGTRGSWRAPLFAAAAIGANPLGASIGALVRASGRGFSRA